MGVIRRADPRSREAARPGTSGLCRRHTGPNMVCGWERTPAGLPRSAAASVHAVARANLLNHERAMQAQERCLRPEGNWPTPDGPNRERGFREIGSQERKHGNQNRWRELDALLLNPRRPCVMLAACAGAVRDVGWTARRRRIAVAAISRGVYWGVPVARWGGIVRHGSRNGHGWSSMTARLTTQPRPETAAAKRDRNRQEEANEGPEWAATVEHGSLAVYTPGGPALCGDPRGSPARVRGPAPFVPPSPGVARQPTTLPGRVRLAL